MRCPPLILGAALLLWGWQTDLIWIALAAAAAVESPRFLPARWEFSQADLDRIWNLCVALFLGATIYAFASSENLTAVEELLKDNSSSSRLATLNQSKRSLFQLLQWFPLMFLPIALAQTWGEQDRMNLSTFSWWLRRRRGKPGDEARYLAIDLNVEYPFFACCLFSASTGNWRSPSFSLLFVALAAWALWQNRAQTFRTRTWILNLGFALLLGFALQLGLLQLQKLVQRLDEVLLAQWSRGRFFETSENQTRIGAIGRLKLSGRIVLRVLATKEPPPALLRETSFTIFRSPVWTSSKREFERISTETNLASWILQPRTGNPQAVTVAGYLHRGNGLIALPHGVQRIENLPALGLWTNLYGSARVEDGPGFIQYQSIYSPDRTIDSPPSFKDDCEIPPQEQFAIEQIHERLRLGEFPKDQAGQEHAVRTIERFFAEDFTYSVWQDERHVATPQRTALARFLLENHAGHCEYFATATALLLRSAGIPARYATGYSVQEKKGRYYVIRERHAHAWCLAWIGGAWREVDTTPATWGAEEAQRASTFEQVRDIFSRMWFEFSKWRWGHAEWKRYMLWLILPLLAFALGKLLWEKQWARARVRTRGKAQPVVWPGADSEYYEVEKALRARGFDRHPGEAARAWLQRLEMSQGVSLKEVHSILQLHYRLRFDPNGLTEPERSQLRSGARAWLQAPR